MGYYNNLAVTITEESVAILDSCVLTKVIPNNPFNINNAFGWDRILKIEDTSQPEVCLYLYLVCDIKWAHIIQFLRADVLPLIPKEQYSFLRSGDENGDLEKLGELTTDVYPKIIFDLPYIQTKEIIYED